MHWDTSLKSGQIQMRLEIEVEIQNINLAQSIKGSQKREIRWEIWILAMQLHIWGCDAAPAMQNANFWMMKTKTYHSAGQEDHKKGSNGTRRPHDPGHANK